MNQALIVRWGSHSTGQGKQRVRGRENKGGCEKMKGLCGASVVCLLLAIVIAVVAAAIVSFF